MEFQDHRTQGSAEMLTQEKCHQNQERQQQHEYQQQYKGQLSILATSGTARTPVTTQTTAKATSRTNAKKVNNSMEEGQIQQECKGVKTTAVAETLETEDSSQHRKTMATAGSTAAEMIGAIQT
jgi:hypothetical protein